MKANKLLSRDRAPHKIEEWFCFSQGLICLHFAFKFMIFFFFFFAYGCLFLYHLLKRLFSLLYLSFTFVESQLDTFACVCFWVLHLVLLVCVPVPPLIPHTLSYYSWAASLNIRERYSFHCTLLCQDSESCAFPYKSYNNLDYL